MSRQVTGKKMSSAELDAMLSKPIISNEDLKELVIRGSSAAGVALALREIQSALASGVSFVGPGGELFERAFADLGAALVDVSDEDCYRMLVGFLAGMRRGAGAS